MKISKTCVGIAVATVALAVGCVAGAGCAAQQPEPSNAIAGTETTPKLMPAQHQKYVDRTAYKCYRCHGASVQGNPTAKNAVAMPNGHYVNNDPSTFELDPIRNECRSCHSVDPNKKLGDDATYEEAEVETGQEGLDD